MADEISEALWKAFTKKQKLELDDKALLKALAALDKTDERKPEPRLEVLAELAKEIPKQVAALVKRKKELGDKQFGLVKDELYAMLEESEKLQKKTRAALDAEGAEDAEDEDSVPSALLNPKLLFKQLSMCRKDPDRTVKFAYVDAKDKHPSTLAVHPRMSSRALFGRLQAASGVKTGAYGTAWVDGMSLMLQLDKPLSGLVKKVRSPVKACGFRITKAVLWNPDGTVFEQDELTEEAVGEGVVQAAPGAPGAPAEPTRAAPTAPPQPSETYEAKLAALLPRVNKAADEGSIDAPKYRKLLEFAAGKAAAKDFLTAVAGLRQVEQLLDSPAPRADAGTAEAGIALKARLSALLPQLKDARSAGRAGALEATAKSTEAGMAAGKRDFDRANALLDEVEALLRGSTDTTAPSDAPAPQAPVKTISIVKLQQLRLAWDTARKKAQSEIGLLQAEILKKAQGEADYDDILRLVKDFEALKSDFDERLIDKLDEALNAQADQRGPLYRQTVDLIDTYQRKVASDPLIRNLDNNPFVKITVNAMLTRTLSVMAQQLA